MKGFGKEVRDILEAQGCSFVRHGRGDHDVWRSPHTEIPFTVPENIASRHTANEIMKDAGLPKCF